MLVGISIIIPCFNEEKYIPSTLESINKSILYAQKASCVNTEIIVVDNLSSDGTMQILKKFGVKILNETEKDIGKVRNTGAKMALYDRLIFVDADVTVPEELVLYVIESFDKPNCLGGGVQLDYLSNRSLVNKYLRVYQKLGRIFNMCQGGIQFARRDTFEIIGGYPVGCKMGEDVKFY